MLSSVMMLNHMGETQAAARLQQAIESVYGEGKHLTQDVGGPAPRPSSRTLSSAG